MGYDMDQVNAKFAIKREDFTAVVKTVQKKLRGDYMWVGVDALSDVENIGELFRVWRYEVEQDGSEGDISDINFIGEKLGDDLLFFRAIAPYVKKGSFIEMSGPDGDRWKWAFDGKKCKEKKGRVVYKR